MFLWSSKRYCSICADLEANVEACTSYRKCEKSCPMSLEVSKMVRSGSMRNTECILCGSCVDNCKFGVLDYSWGREKKPVVETMVER